jgi:glutathione S-transferase
MSTPWTVLDIFFWLWLLSTFGPVIVYPITAPFKALTRWLERKEKEAASRKEARRLATRVYRRHDIGGGEQPTE